MNYPTIKFVCNYSNEINERFSKFFIHNYHKLSINKENPDYFILINHPYDDITQQKKYYDNKRTIYIHNEPVSSREKWEIWKKTETFLFDHKINIKNWDLDININDLIKKKIIKKEEYKRRISCVTTDAYWLEGHKLRTNFLRFLDILPNVNIKPDLYGKKITGIYDELNLKNYLGETQKRENVLWDYYYHFMAENSSEHDYFTEKILDPILTETLCFYWGCPNIKNYLHEKSYISIDLHKPNIAINIIANAINNNEYEKRLKYIKESKKKIIYELNPITLFEKNLNLR